ncbi:DNA transfer protein [Morganella morganii]|uniref:DNA transfer protein n=1 Tax=Morganella morganii TaxID=582 RepID=UPI0034E5F753
MATWNQSINSGGLLAGIGKTNDNAPRASDINATLGMIRDNNELQRSGANNLGLQALSGLRGLADIYQADQQQQRQKEFLQKYGEARAAGDIPSMRGLFAEYPEMGEQIGKGMTGISADTKESIGSLAAGFRTAAATGTGDQFVAKNAAEFLRVGVDPADLQKRLKEDPNSAIELADWVGLSAVGSEKYFDIIDAKEGRQIDQGKLAETVRSNQAGEALTARGQDIQVRGQDISRANAITAAYAPTSAMQNYSQYAQMLKSDPEGAKAFAQAAGINPDQKKLFKVETMPDGSVMKYYADGTEEKGKASDPISDANMRKPLTVREADGILSKASEGSKQAAGFAMRVEDGLSGMKQLIDTGQVSPQRAAFISARLGDGMIANSALSPAEQSYLLHARDTVNAVLRKDTGAAITADETKEYANLYLPQPGESDAALKVKNKKLENRFKTFRGESGLSYEAMKVSSKAYDAQDAASAPENQSQQQPAATQPQRTGQAPAAAIQALKNNPALAEQFQAKYGYLP